MEHNPNAKFVILQRLNSSGKFFMANHDHPELASDGTLSYKVIDYVDSVVDAHIIIFGKSTSEDSLPENSFIDKKFDICLANAGFRKFELKVVIYEGSIDPTYTVTDRDKGKVDNFKSYLEAIRCYNLIKKPKEQLWH